MPAYKDKKNGLWFASFYYRNMSGENVKKKKSGFKTKKEALEYEMAFKLSSQGNLEMTLAEFVNVYFKDKEHSLAVRSKYNKRKMIDAHIIPYLGNKPMNKITAADIIHWEQEIIKKGFSKTYQKTLWNQISALFTHATNIYDLKSNPTKKVDKIGCSTADEKAFWTEEEFETFIKTIDSESHYYLIYLILFWTGIREGELLSLTPADFNFGTNQMTINKSYYRLHGEDHIKEPKTLGSNRVIDVPVFLMNMVKEYIEKRYRFPADERLFSISTRALQKAFKGHIEKTELKKITVHSLRHSHTSWCALNGIDPNVTKRRLGHAHMSTTLDIYTHVLPEQKREVANLIDKKMSPSDGNHKDS